MLLGILYQLQDERRHTHDGVGLDAANGVPLQFGDAVAHTDYACTKFAQTQEISQSRHETLVQGGHQLHHITRSHSSTFKRLLLIESQTLQVFLGTAESHRVAKGTRSSDVVDNFVLRTAKKFVVEELQVFLFGKRNLHQILDMLNLIDIDAIAFEHPLIVGRMGFKISQSLVKQTFLIGLDFFWGLIFYIIHC